MITRPINLVVIHCSASDIPAHDSVDAIRKWHVDERGWSDIGYHFVITKDGVIHKGRPLEISGAHAKGYNFSSIGICLTGDQEFSDVQMLSLKNICILIQSVFGVSKDNFVGHNEINEYKTCPNFGLDKLRQNLN